MFVLTISGFSRECSTSKTNTHTRTHAHSHSHSHHTITHTFSARFRHSGRPAHFGGHRGHRRVQEQNARKNARLRSRWARHHASRCGGPPQKGRGRDPGDHPVRPHAHHTRTSHRRTRHRGAFRSSSRRRLRTDTYRSHRAVMDSLILFSFCFFGFPGKSCFSAGRGRGSRHEANDRGGSHRSGTQGHLRFRDACLANVSFVLVVFQRERVPFPPDDPDLWHHEKHCAQPDCSSAFRSRSLRF